MHNSRWLFIVTDNVFCVTFIIIALTLVLLLISVRNALQSVISYTHRDIDLTLEETHDPTSWCLLLICNFRQSLPCRYITLNMSAVGSIYCNWHTLFHTFSHIVTSLFLPKCIQSIIPHQCMYKLCILMHIIDFFRALLKVCLNNASFSAAMPAILNVFSEFYFLHWLKSHQVLVVAHYTQFLLPQQ